MSTLTKIICEFNVVIIKIHRHNPKILMEPQLPQSSKCHFIQ